MDSNSRNRGFTLIEILVAAALMALLIAALAPVLAQAKEQVRGAICMANIRQLGQAALLYLQDYDDEFASAGRLRFDAIPDQHEPYLSSMGVWRCPSDVQSKNWDGVWGSPSFFVRASFFWNVYIFQGDPSNYMRGLNSAAIPTVTTVPLFGEGRANSGLVGEAIPPSDPTPNIAVLHDAYGDGINTPITDRYATACSIHYKGFPDRRHHGGGNYVFADGHAMWLWPDKFMNAAIYENGGKIVDDRTDPLVTSGARQLAIRYAGSCPVLCCPRNIGMPPGDGDRPWFRP